MGKIAFVFAGQGAQYSGMGQELFEQSLAARAVYELADSLRPGTSTQCFSGTQEELSLTENTQPCMFATDLACAQALAEAGVHPQGAAGFSLGELPALAFCGVLESREAFALVMHRAQLMSECAQANPGGMAAVLRLTNEQVEELCSGFDHVYPVNYNCPGQLVVAGAKEELPAFVERVSAAKGKAVPLAVSGAFHSPFMQGASAGIAQMLAKLTLNAPEIPLYANATGEPYTGDNARELIARQASSPVRWQQTVERMLADGFDTFIEVGPGKTLSGLIKKIAPQARILQVENTATLAAAVEAVLHSPQPE